MPQTADSPAPARTGTPAQASRAPSAHPDPGFTVPPEALPNGDATRRYLNTRVTGALLEGMKMLAKEQLVIASRRISTMHRLILKQTRRPIACLGRIPTTKIKRTRGEQLITLIIKLWEVTIWNVRFLGWRLTKFKGATGIALSYEANFLAIIV